MMSNVKHICQHCKNVMHTPKEWWLDLSLKLVCYVCSNEIKRKDKTFETAKRKPQYFGGLGRGAGGEHD